ncbi:MAG: hypothetical protein E6333_08255 [Staphylococcus epidermidis]|nr:hypothetical protein [Staphylococcus epidermidis]
MYGWLKVNGAVSFSLLNASKSSAHNKTYISMPALNTVSSLTL